MLLHAIYQEENQPQHGHITDTLGIPKDYTTHTNRWRWFRSGQTSKGTRNGHEIVHLIIPVRSHIHMNTGDTVSLREATERVIIKVITTSVKSNNSFLRPVECSTLVSVYDIGINIWVRYNNSLIRVILKRKNIIHIQIEIKIMLVVTMTGNIKESSGNGGSVLDEVGV